MHKPFKVGKVINLEALNVKGVVKEITFRHTIIETESKSIVTIPNAIMNSIAIEDLTYAKEKVTKKKRSVSNR